MATIQVVQPKRNDSFGKLATIGGAVIGGYYTGGSPQGIAMGAGLGSTAGNVLSKDPGTPNQLAQAGGSDSGGAAAAMARRSAQMAADNGDPTNYNTLVAAERAAAELPEQQRQQYLAALTQARMLEQDRLMKAAQVQPTVVA